MAAATLASSPATRSEGDLGVSLRRAGRLLRLGMTGELRNPGLRVLGVIGALGAAAYAWNQGNLPGSTALALSSLLGKGFGIAASLWFGYTAVRDQNEKAGAALRSKPIDGGYWVVVAWLTGLLTWLLLLASSFLAAGLAQLPAAGPASLGCHALGFVQAAVLLVAVATLSFAAARWMRSPLGGILVIFAWFCAMVGAQYIPPYLRPDYSQNRPLYVAAAALLLAITALLVERYRRGELRRPLLPIVTVLMLLLGTLAAARWVYGRTPDFTSQEAVVWDAMTQQHLEPGKRIPGFWLPNGRGGQVRSAEQSGKILMVYLFAGDDLDAARTLPALEAIQKEYGARGVQPIGICLSPDHGDGWLLAQAGGYHFPIGNDISTRTTQAPPEAATANAFYAQTLPMLVVTDRRRIVRSVLSDMSQDVSLLRAQAEERLKAEPE